MPNISRGHSMSGLMSYLVSTDPDKTHNVHTEPHLVAGDPAVMAWYDTAELTHDDALAIARILDHPRRAYEVDVPGGHVWHCSLSLHADEGVQTDERWADLATDFMAEMGLLGGGDETEGGKAPVRWVFVRHGLSKAGNDHGHLAVSLVREDGTKADVWKDFQRAQEVAHRLEVRYGLQVLESRSRGRGDRGITRPELERQKATGAPEPERRQLGRIVRGAATAAVDEAEFVRRLRDAGVLVLPRYERGGETDVGGFSVALRPPAGEKPFWLGGGQLARDLTLPRLREAGGWPVDEQSRVEAVAEWRAGKRDVRPVAPGRERAVPGPELWDRYTADVGALRELLRSVPDTDRVTWARVAGEVAGVFAAWSTREEGSTPGPLAATADALARSAQLRAHEVRVPRAPGPSARGAAVLLSVVAHKGVGPAAQALLLRQLANTARALHDAHQAIGDAQRAAEIAVAARRDIAAVRDVLPPVEPAAGPLVGRGAGPVREVGSVLPADLQRARISTTTGRDAPGVER